MRPLSLGSVLVGFHSALPIARAPAIPCRHVA